ncbi:MAG TPA: NAD(+) diphosphatase [Gemmatimonadaceae bacterium]
MSISTVISPIRYAGGHLDRAGVRRQDAAWVASMREHPGARAVPVWRDQNLVLGLDESARAGGAPRAGWCDGEVWAALARDATITWSLLGLDGDGPLFALDVSVLDGDRLFEIVRHGTFADLRKVGPLVSAEDAALMAYARGILNWHRCSGYCGTCGSATVSEHAGHMRRCTNPGCRAEIYPRTDPAVIMLVERPASRGQPARCLLGRHHRLPPRAYSTLAGFVEPGESLEEAVAREVLEETGVRVSRASYLASQPWPFPASLMLGFRAVADTEEIDVDGHELVEARWFTAEELADHGEWGDESAALRLPRRDSIARALVDAWLADARRGTGS